MRGCSHGVSVHAYADGWRRLFSAVFPPRRVCWAGLSVSLLSSAVGLWRCWASQDVSLTRPLAGHGAARSPRAPRAQAPRFSARTPRTHACVACCESLAAAARTRTHGQHATLWSGCRSVLRACLWSFVLWCGHGVCSVESMLSRIGETWHVFNKVTKHGPFLCNHPERLHAG